MIDGIWNIPPPPNFLIFLLWIGNTSLFFPAIKISVVVTFIVSSSRLTAVMKFQLKQKRGGGHEKLSIDVQGKTVITSVKQA